VHVGLEKKAKSFAAIGFIKSPSIIAADVIAIACFGRNDLIAV
jgi:hypothetical protein